jgi:ribosome biogenesis GTPase
VAIDPPRSTGDRAVIVGLLSRRTAFRRYAGDSTRRGSGRLSDEQVLAANVDVAFVVCGLDGDFDLRRIERYLAVVYAGGATPVVVLNKTDIDLDLEGHRSAVAAVAPGVPIFAISAREGTGVTELVAAHLHPGTTTVVLGSSGVGKSTLANTLLGQERQRTAETRSDSRGRHTTRTREMLRLPSGALLIDTPGIRALEVVGAVTGLDDAFADLETIAVNCRFRDCAHRTEPGCAVRAAVVSGELEPARLASYDKPEREAAHVERTTNPLARTVEQRRWKAINKSVKIGMRAKYGEDR